MSESLVQDLNENGISARRLAPGESLPSTGWLVRGVFTEVQEGNRVRRAVIGFGAGKTELHVLVYLDDLANGAPGRLPSLIPVPTAATNLAAANMLPG